MARARYHAAAAVQSGNEEPVATAARDVDLDQRGAPVTASSCTGEWQDQAAAPQTMIGFMRKDADTPPGENSMRKRATRIIQLALAGLLVSGPITTAQAETGAVRVVFTKGGFIVGVGGGHGVLTFRGRNYPFRVSGISFGATIGASTTQLVGRALNIHGPGDIAGTYSAIGAGGALAGGVGGVQLQNSNGVILQLQGAKVGVELSAAVSGVQIALE
jgi:hypothetical protein